MGDVLARLSGGDGVGFKIQHLYSLLLAMSLSVSPLYSCKRPLIFIHVVSQKDG